MYINEIYMYCVFSASLRQSWIETLNTLIGTHSGPMQCWETVQNISCAPIYSTLYRGAGGTSVPSNCDQNCSPYVGGLYCTRTDLQICILSSILYIMYVCRRGYPDPECATKQTTYMYIQYTCTVHVHIRTKICTKDTKTLYQGYKKSVIDSGLRVGLTVLELQVLSAWLCMPVHVLSTCSLHLYKCTCGKHL